MIRIVFIACLMVLALSLPVRAKSNASAAGHRTVTAHGHWHRPKGIPHPLPCLFRPHHGKHPKSVHPRRTNRFR
jgi:hypothetical protein